MNKEYIVEFYFGPDYIPVKFIAENNELALNQAQGMLHDEWVNLVDIEGNSVRLRSDEVYILKCYESNNN